MKNPPPVHKCSSFIYFGQPLRIYEFNSTNGAAASKVYLTGEK